MAAFEKPGDTRGAGSEVASVQLNSILGAEGQAIDIPQGAQGCLVEGRHVS